MDVTFRDVFSDALRYWEPRRLIYNGALILVVALRVAHEWPLAPSRWGLDVLLALFILAVLANVAYCAVYVIDVPLQFSGYRDAKDAWVCCYWERCSLAP